MTTGPRIELTAVVLGAPRAQELARFYRELLGWEVSWEEPDWVVLRPPGGGTGLSFQTEEDHVPPAWPAGPGEVPMQMHLDLRVEDLDAGVGRAVGCGARVAAFQPQEDVVVLLDPAGHPFCLFVD